MSAQVDIIPAAEIGSNTYIDPMKFRLYIHQIIG